VLRKSGFEALEVTVASALRVRALPYHHRDPFDRLLVAQALEENLTLVTHDSKLADYGVPLLS
jgi:PIN domain nuclease of toxin-antitoxin system